MEQDNNLALNGEVFLKCDGVVGYIQEKCCQTAYNLTFVSERKWRVHQQECHF